MFKLTGHHDGHGLTERCVVEVHDEAQQPSGAHHDYRLRRVLTVEESEERFDEGTVPANSEIMIDVGYIQFQKGQRNVPGSTPGTTEVALLQVLLHRFECFQAGQFSSREGAIIYRKLQEIQHWMRHRVDERARRGVLGHNAK